MNELRRFQSALSLRLAMSIAALLCGSLTSTGCSTWRLWVTVRSTEDTNQGRPLQVLVRSVPAERFREETYADLARLVTTPDKTVVRSVILEPSEQRRLWLSVPSDTPVALYFLVGSTTGSWKMLLPPPLPWSIRVPLGRTGVVVPDVKECRLGRGHP